MKIKEKSPINLEEAHQLILSLQYSLQEIKLELKNEKLKNAYLLEQFRLACKPPKITPTHK